jgi:Condensation domain
MLNQYLDLSLLAAQREIWLAQKVDPDNPIYNPLSYAQQRLWFLDRLKGTSTEYNIGAALRLRGGLDQEALEKTIDTIVWRHESLRTHFGEIDGEPLQVIEEELKIELEVEDLRALEDEKRQAEVKAAMREEANRPFDLARGPLLRMRLLKLGEQDHISIVRNQRVEVCEVLPAGTGCELGGILPDQAASGS